MSEIQNKLDQSQTEDILILTRIDCEYALCGINQGNNRDLISAFNAISGIELMIYNMRIVNIISKDLKEALLAITNEYRNKIVSMK
jgi:hypothetical protein